MKKYLFTTIMLLNLSTIIAQTNSFDVFTYRPPEFFTKTKLPSGVQWSLKNNDTNFCIITIYKSGRPNLI